MLCELKIELLGLTTGMMYVQCTVVSTRKGIDWILFFDNPLKCVVYKYRMYSYSYCSQYLLPEVSIHPVKERGFSFLLNSTVRIFLPCHRHSKYYA
jgi:hypothetical protein